MSAFRIGHPGYRAGRILDRQGPFAQFGRGKLARIGSIEIGERPREQQCGIGQPRKAVFRGGAGHIDRARGQFLERRIRQVARSDRGRAAADEDPQVKMLAFRSLDILELAQPHRDAFG